MILTSEVNVYINECFPHSYKQVYTDLLNINQFTNYLLLMCDEILFSENFIGATIILLTLSTMIAIFIINFHFKGQGVKRPSPWMRKFFLQWLARIVQVRINAVRDATNEAIKVGLNK